MRRLIGPLTLIVLSLTTTAAVAAPPGRARSAKRTDTAQKEADKAEAERIEAEKKKAEADRVEAEKKIEEAKAEQAKAEQAKAEAAKMIEQAKAAQAKPATPSDADTTPAQHHDVDRPTKIEAVGGGASQRLGFGVGLRVGHTMKNHVYGGVDGMLHFTTGDALATYTTGVLGYELDAGALKITPAIGAGAVLFIPTEGKADIKHSPLVYPAVAVRYDVPSTALTVGVDTRLLYITDADATALSLAGTAGLRF